ncbi:MAG: methionine adenosyltransferase [Oscillospiraceae bacterium]|nr:methionine adenosyltransferase [Oscillospiraceae bacterium]
MGRFLFTSESVTEGHPDKLADRISDAVLDAYLREDKNSRVAVETFVKGNYLAIAGEVTSNASPDVREIAREAIREIGYTDNSLAFSADNCEITVKLESQSPDIALGVDRSLESREGGEEELGAGDQGLMFGYACDETGELMPLAISLAHALTKRLAKTRKQGLLPYLRPDGKSQVTVEYRDGAAYRVDAVVISAQHDGDVDIETLRGGVRDEVIMKIIPKELIDSDTKFFINPTGRFVIGGPEGDCGLTGRKIIVDSYGGSARHGGGCFSGKDPTKVDRSAAYMARYIAKNVVAAKLAGCCELQIAYAIGVANPVSVSVVTDRGTEIDEKIAKAICKVFDMRPSAIINSLNLKRPIYEALSSYGHMGREDLDLSWEKTDRTEELKAAFSSETA